MNDAAIIGSLVASLSGTCRHCECHGDSCSIGGGEKCFWMTSTPERTVCSAPACLQKELYRKRDEKRAAERKAAEAKRLAQIPSWMLARRNARPKKSKRGTKARAA